MNRTSSREPACLNLLLIRTFMQLLQGDIMKLTPFLFLAKKALIGWQSLNKTGSAKFRKKELEDPSPLSVNSNEWGTVFRNMQRMNKKRGDQERRAIKPLLCELRDTSLCVCLSKEAHTWLWGWSLLASVCSSRRRRPRHEFSRTLAQQTHVQLSTDTHAEKHRTYTVCTTTSYPINIHRTYLCDLQCTNTCHIWGGGTN